MDFTGIRWIRKQVQRYLQASNGNIGLMLALCILPLLLACGVAIDFSRQLALKSQFDAIADNVALQSVDYPAMYLPIEEAQEAATKQFTAMAQANGNATVEAMKVEIAKGDTGRVATVSYTASEPSSLMALIGIQKLTASGSSSAHSSSGGYLDIYVLADNTPSMGLGATHDDVENLESLTALAFNASVYKGRCGFACHTTGSGYDYFTIARNNGVTLRIDTVRHALVDLIAMAKAATTPFTNYRFALYTFGADATKRGLTNIFPLSPDLTAAKTATNAIDLMSTPFEGYNKDALTDYPSVMTAMNNAIPDSGDGMSQEHSRKILVLISDGADDRLAVTCFTPMLLQFRCIDHMYSSILCKNIKARGITLAVIYTTYLPIPGDLTYWGTIDPINKGPFSPSPNSTIANSMKSCASPGYFQEVGPNDSISSSMELLFKQFVSQGARITG